MFVDPEILEALDEEQKQILFIKMREEQVKRWRAFEEKCEQEGEPQMSKGKDNSRRIRFEFCIWYDNQVNTVKYFRSLNLCFSDENYFIQMVEGRRRRSLGLGYG